MKNKVCLVFLLFVLCSCKSGSGIWGKSMPDVSTQPGMPLEELIYETMDNGEQRLRVKPNIFSREDLLAYRELKISQAREILDATRDQSQKSPYYPVVVTMKRPISFSELNRLIKKYNPTTSKEVAILLEKNVKALPKVELIKDVDTLVVQQLRFVSTVGGGQLSYESLSDPVGLARLEAKIAAKEAQYNGVTNYELVRGVISIKGGVHRDHLMNLEDEPEVFLADIGPKEIYDGTVNVALWEDIYEDVELYMNPQQ